jgi:hypothetical protein
MTVKMKERPDSATTELSRWLQQYIDSPACDKSQREIATDLGYPRANIISMFKSGEAKVPLDKLPALAKSLGVDFAHILRLGLAQYMQDSNADLARAFRRVVTENEMEIIQHVRSISKGSDPAPSDEVIEGLERVFGLHKRPHKAVLQVPVVAPRTVVHEEPEGELVAGLATTTVPKLAGARRKAAGASKTKPYHVSRAGGQN